jgi:orotate phosphoribosyltransferase
MSRIARRALMDMIRQRAYRYQPDDPFTLVSGRKSPFYFNCKAVSLTGIGLNLLGEVLYDALAEFPDIEAVGGLTLGADPLATTVASYATRHGRPLDAFVIRKEAKGHGTRQWLEGDIGAGAPVLVIDDVVTTGSSTVKAIERAASARLAVRGALVLVDREEEDGVANIEQALEKVGAPRKVVAVYRASDFLAQ